MTVFKQTRDECNNDLASARLWYENAPKVKPSKLSDIDTKDIEQAISNVGKRTVKIRGVHNETM